MWRAGSSSTATACRTVTSGQGNPTIGVGVTFDLVFDQALLDLIPMQGDTYPYYYIYITHTSFGMIGAIVVLFVVDLDGDTDVDLVDHAHMGSCLTGPGYNVPIGGCSITEFDRSDVDKDDDIDLQDMAAIQRAFTG